MKISTRARYGTRLMLQLALRYGKGLTLLKDVARQEGLSEKYLSQIIIPLRVSGLVASGRGAHGGYRLTRPPAEITMRQIIEALDGAIALTERVKKNPALVQRHPGLVTQSVWDRLGAAIAQTLEGIVLQELVEDYQRQSPAAVSYDI